jgi:hypothetical protein
MLKMITATEILPIVGGKMEEITSEFVLMLFVERNKLSSAELVAACLEINPQAQSREISRHLMTLIKLELIEHLELRRHRHGWFYKITPQGKNALMLEKTRLRELLKGRSEQDILSNDR